ncbi:MAG: PHP domain-containing protein [Microbacteriaceae bacterium]
MSDPRIDLHLHSNRSDGSESPAVVMRAAKDAGLNIVALTDHDTTDGWDEARTACADLGLTFVPGIEFSASHRGAIVHLLGYLVDPTEPTFAETCARTRDDRQWRFEKMVDNLHHDFGGMTREFAYSFHVEGATLGRPTIARALIDLGIVSTVSEAFDDLLSSSNERYYAGHYAPTIEDAIAIVRNAGGVPVLAHPWTSTRTTLVAEHDTDEQISARFAELVAAGLAGLEVHHEENTPYGRTRLAQIAAEYDLIVTGSSDYHGLDTKPVKPGAHTTSLVNFERIVALGTGSAVS